TPGQREAAGEPLAGRINNRRTYYVDARADVDPGTTVPQPARPSVGSMTGAGGASRRDERREARGWPVAKATARRERRVNPPRNLRVGFSRRLSRAADLPAGTSREWPVAKATARRERRVNPPRNLRVGFSRRL